VGLKGYSRMRKSSLQESLRTVVVYRQDRKAMAVLRNHFDSNCWLALKVLDWDKKRGCYKPGSWLVPVGLLGTVIPLSSKAAAEIRERRSAAARKAKETIRAKDDEAAVAIGAQPGSRLGRALRQGELDKYEAQLLAFKSRYRHEHTDYEALLDAGCDQEDARSIRQEEAPPENWAAYLDRYGFDGPVSEAMARILEDPGEAHPVWFCEAKIAVEKAVAERRLTDLSTLSYETIRECVDYWRCYRY
jgi:hypothetical protein